MRMYVRSKDLMESYPGAAAFARADILIRSIAPASRKGRAGSLIQAILAVRIRWGS